MATLSPKGREAGRGRIPVVCCVTHTCCLLFEHLSSHLCRGIQDLSEFIQAGPPAMVLMSSFLLGREGHYTFPRFICCHDRRISRGHQAETAVSVAYHGRSPKQ
ncbi:unnamed protein product [Ectocarpus fasciculatus]